MEYRRSNIKNGCYFFTLNLQDRTSTLLVDKIDVLRNEINRVKKQHPFRLDALVILPDHLHTIWTLSSGDKDYPTRWMLIKAGFSRRIKKGEQQSLSRQKKGERGIWQRRYWEHLIRDEKDYQRHIDYIHYNPVKHGYVKNAVDWEYSSIHRYIRDGVMNRYWGCTEQHIDVLESGER